MAAKKAIQILLAFTVNLWFTISKLFWLACRQTTPWSLQTSTKPLTALKMSGTTTCQLFTGKTKVCSLSFSKTGQIVTFFSIIKTVEVLPNFHLKTQIKTARFNIVASSLTLIWTGLVLMKDLAQMKDSQELMLKVCHQTKNATQRKYNFMQVTGFRTESVYIKEVKTRSKLSRFITNWQTTLVINWKTRRLSTSRSNMTTCLLPKMLLPTWARISMKLCNR